MAAFRAEDAPMPVIYERRARQEIIDSFESRLVPEMRDLVRAAELMAWFWLAAVPVLLALGGATPEMDSSVSYELAPAMRGDAITGLDVTIRLRADSSGVTTLDWIESWGGEDKLGQWARDIRVEGATAVSVAPYGGRIVRSKPGAALVMRYRIVSGYAADPTVKDNNRARPVVRPGWFYSVGESLYARPIGRDDAPARFHWHGPKAIGFASDTEHATGLGGHPRKVSDVQESIAIGGRGLILREVNLNGAPVRIAHIGSFGFDTGAFEMLAQKIVTAEREFWRETKAEPYLITAVPLIHEPGRLSYGGTGRSDAFATWIDHDADLDSLAWLLAHEYFHSWNARQLGRLPDKDEAQAYWLSEGFTDFYARKLLLRSGIWSPERFVADWNEMLRAYAESGFRTTGNVEAAAKYWSGDYAAEKIPYQRGAMLAALWDRQLRMKSLGDLDKILASQRDRTGSARKEPELISAFIAEMGHAGLDIRGDIDRYLTRGEPILLPEDALGSCANIRAEDIAVFERGWDPAAVSKAGNILVDIDPASNAYAAGLRDGMKIVRRVSGETGNSQVDYVLQVQDGATVRTITFRPAGKKKIRTQKIVLDAARFAAETERCRAELAG